MYLVLGGQTQTESENMETPLWLGKLAREIWAEDHESNPPTPRGLITSPTLTQPTPTAARAHFAAGLASGLAH